MARKSYSDKEREQVKEALLITVLESIVNQGLVHSSIAILCEKVGISKTFFYSFFLSKINRHSPYLSITLHKCYPYYLFGISTFPSSVYHSIALRKFSITIV